MSPLRSSAGPATWRMPTPSSRRTICASDVLPSPGGPGEQDVVERLAARLRRVERDRELLLDALLADEVGERSRAAASARAPPRRRRARREERGSLMRPASSAARTCSSTGRSRRRRRARARRRAATSRARRARRGRARSARSADSRIGARPSFSFSSSTTRCAVLRPMPGIASKRAVSSRAIARRSSAGVEPETIASATFGPTPETPSSSSKSWRSSAEANP